MFYWDAIYSPLLRIKDRQADVTVKSIFVGFKESQTNGKETICIHVRPSFSRNKGKDSFLLQTHLQFNIILIILERFKYMYLLCCNLSTFLKYWYLSIFFFLFFSATCHEKVLFFTPLNSSDNHIYCLPYRY